MLSVLRAARTSILIRHLFRYPDVKSTNLLARKSGTETLNDFCAATTMPRQCLPSIWCAPAHLLDIWALDNVVVLHRFRNYGAMVKALYVDLRSGPRLKCDVSPSNANACDGTCTTLNQLPNTCLGAKSIAMGQLTRPVVAAYRSQQIAITNMNPPEQEYTPLYHSSTRA